MEQLGKPVPDVCIIGHIGKQAFLHWLWEIWPKLESRPAKDFLKVRHRQSPSLNGPIKNTRRWLLFL
ncbi:MAG TPA: hypothetical protein VGC82_08515 [Rhodopila sp.]